MNKTGEMTERQKDLLTRAMETISSVLDDQLEFDEIQSQGKYFSKLAESYIKKATDLSNQMLAKSIICTSVMSKLKSEFQADGIPQETVDAFIMDLQEEDEEDE
jgi:hypothetical protein